MPFRRTSLPFISILCQCQKDVNLLGAGSRHWSAEEPLMLIYWTSFAWLAQWPGRCGGIEEIFEWPFWPSLIYHLQPINLEDDIRFVITKGDIIEMRLQFNENHGCLSA
jgi:hypothetical protein